MNCYGFGIGFECDVFGVTITKVSFKIYKKQKNEKGISNSCSR